MQDGTYIRTNGNRVEVQIRADGKVGLHWPESDGRIYGNRNRTATWTWYAPTSKRLAALLRDTVRLGA